MRVIEKAILRTLAYGDIFDYPLNSREVYFYLITKRQFDRDSVLRALMRIAADSKLISTDGEYYYLEERDRIVGLRKRREKWSREKIKKAQRIANFLKIIPTVKLVGISGALAMENANDEDDIDLFIVTSAKRLWLTRFLVTVLVELMGQRRRPLKPNLTPEVGELPPKAARKTSGVGEEVIRDKICLNMFLDENYLAILLKERNLYTAHEVAQMKKIWDRDNTYQKFLVANSWVGDYLPNGIRSSNDKAQMSNQIQNPKSKKEKCFNFSISQFLNFLEKALMVFQLKYMERRRTTEKISPGRILFHPEDKGEWVMGEYKRKITNINE